MDHYTSQQTHPFPVLKRDDSILNGTTSLAQNTSGQTVGALLSSTVTGLIIFGVQTLVFLLLRLRFTRL